MNKEELIKALDSSEGLFKWTYDLHNKVNKSLGIPENEWPDYETVYKRYESFKSDCSAVPGACNTAVSKKKITVKIMEGEHDNEFYYKLVIFILTLILVCIIMYTLLKARKR